MNITEAQIMALWVRSNACMCELEAMKANDVQSNERYTEEAYIRVSNELYSISDQIQLLSRAGGLNDH